MTTRINFDFYESAPRSRPCNTGLTKIGHRTAELFLESDDVRHVSLGDYGSPRYAYMVVTAGSGTGDSSLGLSTRPIRRVRGSHRCQPGIILVTIAEMQVKEAEGFLAQFATASEYIERQRGFCAARLYAQQPQNGIATFVNVATWASWNRFVTTFSSDDFKAILKGGFEARSFVMSARVPEQAAR